MYMGKLYASDLNSHSFLFQLTLLTRQLLFGTLKPMTGIFRPIQNLNRRIVYTSVKSHSLCVLPGLITLFLCFFCAFGQQRCFRWMVENTFSIFKPSLIMDLLYDTILWRQHRGTKEKCSRCWNGDMQLWLLMPNLKILFFTYRRSTQNLMYVLIVNDSSVLII